MLRSKNELLFSHGINYDKLPAWQKRGIGLWKEEFQIEGYNPVTKTAAPAVRTRIRVCDQLPLGDEYAEMIRKILTAEKARESK